MTGPGGRIAIIITDGPARRVVVFTRTTRYRHESIPAGVAALGELGAAHGYLMHPTEDPGVFTPGRLDDVAVVVFLNTSGPVLDGAQRDAFAGFVRGGGGFLGVHLAAGTEPDWPFYRALVGARFTEHPHIQPGTIRVVDPAHPATAHLPDPWVRVDEFYNYDAAPGGVEVLLRLDESSYTGGTMGTDHPLTWCHEYAGGRAFYTGLGHGAEAYHEPEFRALLAAGLRYAAGETAGVPG